MTVRLLFIALLLIPIKTFAGACSETITGTESCNVITRHGITWTLSTNETVGQYVLGDYWVLDDGNVSISSISPTPSGGRNGSQKNPTTQYHPFDSRAAKYNAALLFTGGSVEGGDAIVSTISRTTETQDWDDHTLHSVNTLKSMEILTIVPSAPSTSPRTFRPAAQDRYPYITFTTADIDDTFLPDLSTSGMSYTTGSYSTMADYLERGSSRPWLLWGNDWEARAIHPFDNMYDYHEEIGQFLSTIMLAIMSDQKTDAMLYGFLQIIIDYRWARNQDSCVWSMPYALGGLLLDSAYIYDYWIDNPGERNNREHEKLYYVDDVTPSHTSSLIPTGKTWVEWTNDTGDYVAFRKQVGEEYEHLHPSEWVCYSPDCKGEVYRVQHDIYSLVGMTLATMIADELTVQDVNAMIAHDPTKDYVHRWMEEGFQTDEYDSTGRTYRQEMEYYTNFTIYFYRYGSASSSFINSMWDEYKDFSGGTTCADSATYCTTEGDCTTYYPTYNWCTDTCQAQVCGYPPPTLSAGAPSGTLAYGTTTDDLEVTTNENASCFFEAGTCATVTVTSGDTAFTTGQGTTSHSYALTGLTNDTSYDYCVACEDTDNNLSDEYSISFYVDASAGASCDTSHYWLCATSETCEGVDGDPFDWWGDACRTIAAPADWLEGLPNQIINGDFASGVAVTWVQPYSGNGSITDASGSAQLYNAGASWPPMAITQEMPSDGETYRYVVNIISVSAATATPSEDGLEVYTPNEGSTFEDTVGTMTGLVTTTEGGADSIYFQAHPNEERSVVIDDIQLKGIFANPPGLFRGIGFSGVTIK